MQLSRLQDLCKTKYGYINHGLSFAFVERWHAETLLFYFSIDEIFVIIGNVSFILHLLITKKLLKYSKTSKLEALDMMVIYLGVGPGKTQEEIDDTRECHARFSFLVDLYDQQFVIVVDMDTYHITSALRTYLLILSEHPFLWTKVRHMLIYLSQIFH